MFFSLLNIKRHSQNLSKQLLRIFLSHEYKAAENTIFQNWIPLLAAFVKIRIKNNNLYD